MELTEKLQLIIALLGVGALIWVTGYKEYSKKHLAAFVAGWVFPGLGYMMFNRKNQFMIFSVSLTFLYIVGLIISNFGLVGIEDNIYYYICQFGSLPSFILGELLKEQRPFITEPFSLTLLDPAQLYVCTASLLNYLVAISIFNIKKTPDTEPVRRA